jgi:circadian clock protein KaiC
MERIKSGIEGLDKLLYGGLPPGRAYLVSGEPGTGKTIFSLQYLLQGLKNGEKCIYISIDEKPEHVILDATELGWDVKHYLKNGQLKIIDVTTYFGTSILGIKEGININQIISDILGFVKDFKAVRLAIDPIAPLVFAEKNIPEVVEYIRQLIFSIEDNSGCTTLLTSYVPVGSNKVSQHGIEEFVASGIIMLSLTKTKNKYIRTIGIRKMRGTRIDLSEYSFEILPSRGVVLRQPISQW